MRRPFFLDSVTRHDFPLPEDRLGGKRKRVSLKDVVATGTSIAGALEPAVSRPVQVSFRN